MALRFVQAVDLFDWSGQVFANVPLPTINTITMEDFRIQSFEGGSGGWGFVYDGARDRFIAPVQGVRTPSQGAVIPLAFDPQRVDLTSPRTLFGIQDTSADGFEVLGWTGYFDAALGSQRLYHSGKSYVNSGANLLYEVDPTTLIVMGAAGGGTVGGHTDVAGGTPTISYRSAYGWIVFEGLTDGIPGETLLQGANVYPDGLALVSVRDVDLNDAGFQPELNASGFGLYAFAWIDMATGKAAGILRNLPAKATSASNQGVAEPSIGGSNFRWTAPTFIPDEDSTPAQPKGELFLASRRGGLQLTNNFDQVSYVRWADFNPFNVEATAGNPIRVHERVTLTSAIEFNQDPVFDVAVDNIGSWPFTNTNDAEVDSGSDGGVLSVLYHPPTRQVFCLIADNGDSNVVGVSFLGIWSRAVNPDIFSQPLFRDVPATNSVADFDVLVEGSLGEPVIGQQVDFTLQRLSTIREALTITGGIGTTSTVANGPIDDSFPSQNEGTLVVYRDDSGVETILEEGTDYTVVLATGVITWVTDQSGATGVAATYFHSTTAATPPHGTLLVSSSLTNENGIASTRVSYPEDSELVGHIDDISSALG